MRKNYIAAMVMILGLSVPVYAGAQHTFKSPEEAVSLLVTAAKDKDSKSIHNIFGAEAHDIITSGDFVSDQILRKRFIEAYDESHKITNEDSNKSVLVIGNGEWPFPIPIIQKEGGWQFDILSGKEEILARRIGRNELNAIQVILSYVDAQNDYAELMRKESGQPFYAQRLISAKGKKDGLYWPAKEGDGESPLGELFAAAAMEGYTPHKGQNPYHGYYYRILTGQGSAAPGGAANYIVKDKMIGGFGLVAWPAKYGNSGVMTFIVSHAGDVYQKDLGNDTAKSVAKITVFNPDESWIAVPASLAQPVKEDTDE